MTREQPEPARNDRSASDLGPDLIGPLLSGAIFGYFGFFAGLQTENDAGTVPLWAATLWVFRLSALLFLGSAVAAIARARRAELIYGVCGGVATLGLAGVGVWSWLDPEFDIAVHPLLMIVVVVWNAYGSFRSIRDGLR